MPRFSFDLIRRISALWQGDPAEEGQGLVEYALILFLVAMVVIGVLIVFGPQVGRMFSAVTKGLS
jgi:pilus assembly protein Flp/PilA